MRVRTAVVLGLLFTSSLTSALVIPAKAQTTCLVQAKLSGIGVPSEVTVEGSATGTPPFSYTWEFGDGGSATGQNSQHTYTTAGNYSIVLDVIGGDKSSCKAATQVLVQPISSQNEASKQPVITSGNTTLEGTRGSLRLYSRPPAQPKSEPDQGWPSTGTPQGNTSLSTFQSPPTNVTVAVEGKDPPIEAWRNSVVLNTTFYGGGWNQEPAIAASRDSVFYTSNFFDGFSTDGGGTWGYINASANVMGSGWAYSGGDQDVVYSASANLFIWYRQVQAGSAPRNIISVVTPSGLTTCDWLVGPSDTGLGSDNWFDYPQLSTSDNYVYLTTNDFGWPGLIFGGFPSHGTMVMRFPLSELSGCVLGSSNTLSAEWNWIHYDACFISCPFLNAAPIDRGTDTMYFATHVSTSDLKILTWREGMPATSADVTHLSFPSTSHDEVCGPSTLGYGNPCGFFDDRVRGGWLGGQPASLYFYWDVKQHDDYATPYTFILGVGSSSLNCCSYSTLISGQYAMVDAFIARNQLGDKIGISVMVANRTTAASTAFGYDSSSFPAFGGTFTVFSQGRSNPPGGSDNGNRWGDYSRIRPYYGGAGVSWVGAGYRLSTRNCCTNTSAVELRSYFLGPTGVMDFNMSLQYRSLSTERDLAALPATGLLVNRLSISEEAVHVSVSPSIRGINVSSPNPDCDFHTISSPCFVRINVVPNDTAPFGFFTVTFTGTTITSHLSESLSFRINIRPSSGGILSYYTGAQYASNILHFGLRGNGSFIDPSILTGDRVIRIPVIGDSKKVGLFELDVPKVFLDGKPVVLIDEKVSLKFAYEQNSTYYQVYFSDAPGNHTISVEGLNTYNSLSSGNPPSSSPVPQSLLWGAALAASVGGLLVFFLYRRGKHRSLTRANNASP